MKPIATLAKLAGFIAVIGGAILLFKNDILSPGMSLLWAVSGFIGICSVACFLNHLWQTIVSKADLQERTQRGLLVIGGVCALFLLAISIVGQTREKVVITACEAKDVLQVSNMVLKAEISTNGLGGLEKAKLEQRIFGLLDATNQLATQVRDCKTQIGQLQTQTNHLEEELRACRTALDDSDQRTVYLVEYREFILVFNAQFADTNYVNLLLDPKAALRRFCEQNRRITEVLAAEKESRTKRPPRTAMSGPTRSP